MERFSDIGAAVIGSGFIGTVHIEALRRLGVQVRGVLDISPEVGEQATSSTTRRSRPSLLPAGTSSARSPSR